ncbi:hypothetical protein [Streptacidiphilus albus]|uniref:hypothetical protein n=1 Tax=Streptacidiphilus albus TaxID=105425 RepID=UPI000AEB94C0|nr:hypothetical protein [Streptacidiphilus albus]
MDNNDQFSDFLKAVEALHDDGPVRTTAHTSNSSAAGWETRAMTETPTPATDTQ